MSEHQSNLIFSQPMQSIVNEHVKLVLQAYLDFFLRFRALYSASMMRVPLHLGFRHFEHPRPYI